MTPEIDLSRFIGMPRPKVPPRYIETRDGIEEFREALRSHDLYPEGIVADGEIHRFSNGKRPSDTSAFYCLNQSEWGYYGCYGDWARDAIPIKFSSFHEHELDAQQLAELRRHQAEQKAQLEEENRRRLEAGRIQAKDGLEQMITADPNFPYFKRKGITPTDGVKMTPDLQMIAIPMYDIEGNVQTYQRINRDGTKRFMMGGSCKDAFYILKGDTSRICICEGYATSVTVSQAMGYMTVAAFSAGNIKGVAKQFKQKYPESQIVICADNDHEKEKNTGLLAAQKAANAVSGKFVHPPAEKGITDFNDLAARQGIEAVSFHIKYLLVPEQKFHPILLGDPFDGISSTQWVIKGVLEDIALAVLFGTPGSYKSFVALSWGLSIATGTDWYGHSVTQGPVFYIVGEGEAGIRKRAAAWCKGNSVHDTTAPFYISSAPMQLLDETSAAEVATAILKLRKMHGKPAAVFIDTLARNLGPGDENSTADMTKFISTLDRTVGRDCLRLIVHHTGHSSQDRARGSSALKAAVDVEYRIEKRADDSAILTNTKMKDEPMWSSSMVFSPQVVELKEDEGEKITSIYLKHVGTDFGKTSATKKLSVKQKAILAFLRELTEGKHVSDHYKWEGGHLHRKNVIDALVDAGLSQRKHVDRSLEQLEGRGLIHFKDEILEM